MEEYSKRHYSYFIVKPDGIRYLDDICQTIEGKFPSVRYYAIQDFKGTIKSLYHKHYERKGNNFAESFDAFLYGLSELFGNESILILVADGERPYQELMQSVFDTKQELNINSYEDYYFYKQNEHKDIILDQISTITIYVKKSNIIATPSE